MKTIIIALVASISFAACTTDSTNPLGTGSDVGSGNSVQQECGLPPPAPSIAYETTTDTDGNQIVIIPAEQFTAFNKWATSAMEDWALCALNNVQ